ncbi:MAG TPA: hypothetical protein VD794_16190, partial [Flavisolibacter sp.]|nr:hypothetical protein [Flavisolibacter sp.]
FVTGPSKSEMQDTRSTYYLIDAFDKLYNHQLSKLPSWKAWTAGVEALQTPTRHAFAGKENLHLHNEQIANLATIYQQLKKEYQTTFANKKMK